MCFIPGWENGIDAEPSVVKKDRCLFLNNVFHHVNGSDVMVGYLFWEASLCKSTRKRMSQGFKYICEMPREFSEENIGTTIILCSRVADFSNHTIHP